MTSLVTGRLWGPDEICPKPKQCFQFLFVSFSCNHISTLQISILLSYTLPETNELHLKMYGWKTIISFWGPAYFLGRAVSFRDGILLSYSLLPYL